MAPAGRATLGHARAVRSLDANGDGYLTRAEASAAQPIADMYDSMDTNATLEKQAKHGNAGIDYAQFKAGIEAARSSGAFGPAVSGGQTYRFFPTGIGYRSNRARAARRTTTASRSVSSGPPMRADCSH